MNIEQNSFKFIEAFKMLKEYLLTILKMDDMSFNLIGHSQFLLMIPRRKEKVMDQIGINAVGFMGSILLKDEKLFDQLEYLLKPSDILR